MQTTIFPDVGLNSSISLIFLVLIPLRGFLLTASANMDLGKFCNILAAINCINWNEKGDQLATFLLEELDGGLESHGAGDENEMREIWYQKS